MKLNIKFIPQNIAPLGVKSIGVYNNDDARVGNIVLGKLKPKNSINKLSNPLIP